MLLDFKTLGDCEFGTHNVCIVGCGPAAIALALELEKSGLLVLIIESGDVKRSLEAQKLNAADVVNYPFDPEGSRYRGIGGTTHVWTGKLLPMESLDFEVKSWINNSGWPISDEEVSGYYKKAYEYFGFCPQSDTREVPFSKQQSGNEEDSIVLERAYWADPPTRFSKKYLSVLEQSQVITVLYNATVSRLELDKEGNSIEGLTIANGSKTFGLSVNTVVIACGGIENPRLLLESGLGAKNKNVGLYFHEHPKTTLSDCGRLYVSDYYRELLIRDTKDGYREGVNIKMSRSSIEEGRMFSHCIFPVPVYKEVQTKGYAAVMELRESIAGQASNSFLLRSFWRVIRHFPSALDYIIKRVRKKPLKLLYFNCENHLEQQIRPENRIELSKKIDSNGSALPSIVWSMTEKEVEDLKQFHQYVRDHCQKYDIGLFESPLLDDPSFRPLYCDASHHMGATRMGLDPAISVVDKNLKFHGLDNLYVTGASVMPTGGHANPTLCLMALSIRLADHLSP